MAKSDAQWFLDLDFVRCVEEFISANPDARLIDIMAEFEMSDIEARAVLDEIRRAIRDGWELS